MWDSPADSCVNAIVVICQVGTTLIFIYVLVGEKALMMLWFCIPKISGKLWPLCQKTGTVQQVVLLLVSARTRSREKFITMCVFCSVVGTSSLRRAAQLKKRFPHLHFKDIVSFFRRHERAESEMLSGRRVDRLENCVCP